MVPCGGVACPHAPTVRWFGNGPEDVDARLDTRSSRFSGLRDDETTTRRRRSVFGEELVVEPHARPSRWLAGATVEPQRGDWRS